MLKNLTIRNIKPDMIYAIIAQINNVDLESNNCFEQYAQGVYRHDGYMFNFDGFIENGTNNKLIDKWVDYGVCDNYEQILEQRKDILDHPNKNFVIGLSTVEKKNQESWGGWRWHKWGEYIGNQNPQHEYLYDEEGIEKVYCYHIYEIE
jgi:hypothetical protein